MPLTAATVTNVALIVAAGRGSRAAAPGHPPKQYAALARDQVLTVTVRAFIGHPAIDTVLVVIHPDDRAAYEVACAPLSAMADATPRVKLLPPVPGGASRQESVKAGLDALIDLQPRTVLIHDAARPFVSGALITRTLDALHTSSGAIPGVAVADTLKRADALGRITGTQERAGLWRAQTPQAFRFADIHAAHNAAASAGRADFTDDSALAEWAGLAIALVAGEERNRKLTTQEDIAMANREMTHDQVTAAAALLDVRMATGFDVHRFTAGDHVWLCGVFIPHDMALEGHSDADVGLHALTDAILGAIADGDIGQHFPPSDPKWKGAASHLFLADAVRRVKERGGVIAHADVTLLCETPKISPHRDAMRARIAEICGLDIGRVAVKATTTERLGFTGRREGIAAQAAATVRLPF